MKFTMMLVAGSEPTVVSHRRKKDESMAPLIIDAARATTRPIVRVQTASFCGLSHRKRQTARGRPETPAQPVRHRAVSAGRHHR